MAYQLNNRALVRLSGVDAESFLQAQLGNDITKLGTDMVQLSAYCQHQGKILALFWVIREGGGFLLSFPIDLLNTIIPRLKMFVLMSDVIITDISNKYKQIGHIDGNFDNTYTINKQLSVELIALDKATRIEFSDQNEWHKACIKALLPEVFYKTTGLFVPQMLNLDIDEIGVNFSKGCYPGQEIVARLQYLGKAKRRLFAFKCFTPIEVGDLLHCASSKSHKLSGIVVSQVKCEAEFLCLATLEVKHKDDIIKLNSADGVVLTRIKNE